MFAFIILVLTPEQQEILEGIVDPTETFFEVTCVAHSGTFLGIHSDPVTVISILSYIILYYCYKLTSLLLILYIVQL